MLSASVDENPELFWGLRGGGGNFGIVTAITYRLHPIGPTVLAGSLVYEFKRVHDALRLYGEFSAAAPDALVHGCGACHHGGRQAWIRDLGLLCRSEPRRAA